MKNIIKLILAASLLVSVHTSQAAFWGDIGDKFITITKVENDYHNGSKHSTVTNTDVQLKKLHFMYHPGHRAWWAFAGVQGKKTGGRRLGYVADENDIKLVEKYVKKYQ
jgi:hypothetical protein